MRVNVARVWEDSDYARVRNMCESGQGWCEVYKKKSITVYTQSVPCSNYQMIKLSYWSTEQNGWRRSEFEQVYRRAPWRRKEGAIWLIMQGPTVPGRYVDPSDYREAVAKYSDVSPSVAYDVLHDSAYRSHWDRHMAAQCYIGRINPNNDIGYYALSAMPPIRARDFVMQRSWLDTGHEKMICGHSVCHQDYPPMKGYVRATAILSAYLIRSIDDEEGCEITYISHTDPRGKLPTWLVNRITRVVAPKIVKRLHKACLAYPNWKAGNKPNFKPWIYPEQQLEFPRVDLAKCQPQDYEQEIIDESNVSPVKNVEVEED